MREGQSENMKSFDFLFGPAEYLQGSRWKLCWAGGREGTVKNF